MWRQLYPKSCGITRSILRTNSIIQGQFRAYTVNHGSDKEKKKEIATIEEKTSTKIMNTITGMASKLKPAVTKLAELKPIIEKAKEKLIPSKSKEVEKLDEENFLKELHKNEALNEYRPEKNSSEPVIVDSKMKDWFDRVKTIGTTYREKAYDKIVDHVDEPRRKSDGSPRKEGFVMREVKSILRHILHRTLVFLLKIVCAYQLGKLIPKGIESIMIKRFRKRIANQTHK